MHKKSNNASLHTLMAMAFPSSSGTFLILASGHFHRIGALEIAFILQNQGIW